MKITIFILKFFFLGMLFIVSNYNLHIDQPVDRATFYELFYSWLSNLSTHSQQIVGYVVDSQWLPQENSPGPLAGVTDQNG